MSVPRIIVALLILLAVCAGCATAPSATDASGKKADPVTTDRSQSK